jgi:hypothetical protein
MIRDKGIKKGNRKRSKMRNKTKPLDKNTDITPLQDPSIGEKGGERERKGEKERESFTEILSFLERFSPRVESQYSFYGALSLQKGENLSFTPFLSLSLPLPSFTLTEVSCWISQQQRNNCN